MVDFTEDRKTPWLACLTNSTPSCSLNQPLGRLSFTVLNYFAWNETGKQIDTFGNLNTVGFIGTQYKDVDCIFPGDGGTTERSNNGCGCMTTTHPDQCKDGYDWCNRSASQWDGVCAMKPDQLAEMLTQFKARANEFKYNEAVVNGMKWNSNISKNLEAFVLPTGDKSQCGKETKCYTDFVAWYADYKAQHGNKTILGFDVTNKDTPFIPLPQTLEETSTGNFAVII